MTGVVRLNLHKKGVISKFRPGRPRSLAFEFNIIMSSTILCCSSSRKEFVNKKGAVKENIRLLSIQCTNGTNFLKNGEKMAFRSKRYLYPKELCRLDNFWGAKKGCASSNNIRILPGIP